MRIDPAIAALRRDPTPQRRAQAAMGAAGTAWRAEPAAAALLADFQGFAAGAPLESCPRLEALFSTPDAAPAVATSLIRRFCAALREEPFGHLPFRHGYEAGHSTLVLARAGSAQLVLCGSEPGRHEATTASFSDAVRYEAVLAGEARARLLRRAPATGEISAEQVELRAGVCLTLDRSSEAIQVHEVGRQLIVLCLQRTARDPGPNREHDLEHGALVRQWSADPRASRHEMMLALLGRMGRSEAAPVMAAMAREPGSDSLRWQALRECLALDTAAGFRALVAVARRADDPLAEPAGALRAQLVEAHPQLLALETAECPA